MITNERLSQLRNDLLAAEAQAAERLINQLATARVVNPRYCRQCSVVTQSKAPFTSECVRWQHNEWFRA
jgi:hypothetical protein